MTLKTCYAANARPDALMKEQLVEMTGVFGISLSLTLDVENIFELQTYID